jgi:spermidine/putrescine transport system permease protein
VTIRERSGTRGAIGVGRTPVPLGAFFAAMLVLLYVPIALLFVFSFNADTLLSFPLDGFTLDWYAAVIDEPSLIGAARNSLIVATGSATAATTLGALVAVAVLRFRFRGRRLLLALAALPLVVPFVVLAVALFLLFAAVDVPRGLLTVAAGHTVIAIPYATLILLARLVGLDPALEDAAMDLGATYPTTLRQVVLPLMGPSLLSAWLTCFIVSFDEIAIAIFLVGGDPTFPVFLYGQLRFAQRLPVLIAMAVLLMVFTVMLTLVALRLSRRDAQPSSAVVTEPEGPIATRSR